MKPFATTLLLVAASASPLLAQGRRAAAPADEAASVQRAALTISEEDYRRRIGIIADDSMRGRGTPSPELEKVAGWIASEFERFGLRPGGDNGTFLQRYPIHRMQLDSASFVMAMGHGAHGHWVLGREAALSSFGGDVGQGSGSGTVVLMVGMPTDTANPFGGTDIRGAVVIHVAPRIGRGGANVQPMLLKAHAAGALAWVFLTSESDSLFARRMARVLQPSVSVAMNAAGPATPGMPVFTVHDGAATAVLSAAGEDLAALRASNAPAVRALNGFSGAFNIHYSVDEQTSAPNTIGIIEGSDPVLKNEYIFFTGHMDHLGYTGSGQNCNAVGADSICNGADDDASGTTGVVMLAQAFSQMAPRPRRSLVFMTVSGEERGLWGSRWYSEHPELPLAQTVADINMDMIGRYYDNHPGWRDTIAVIGKEHSTLGASANRVTQEHPELHMRLVDDMWPAENFYRRSDHFNFARKGVPILFFFNGTHPDYHRVTDSVDKIDAEKASRIVKMVFYLGLDVANAAERPQWNPESRRQIVEAGN
ncbi:MAG: M28 family peptidase [Gemmatimonadales bacterium]